jgi:hypothetical protein
MDAIAGFAELSGGGVKRRIGRKKRRAPSTCSLHSTAAFDLAEELFPRRRQASTPSQERRLEFCPVLWVDSHRAENLHKISDAAIDRIAVVPKGIAESACGLLLHTSLVSMYGFVVVYVVHVADTFHLGPPSWAAFSFERRTYDPPIA